jgi:hypothetical protein
VCSSDLGVKKELSSGYTSKMTKQEMRTHKDAGAWMLHPGAS